MSARMRQTPLPLLLILFVCMPISAFYVLTTYEAVNVPFLDDYDAILNYLLYQRSLPSFSSKLIYALTVEHNTYRLIFEHAVLAVNMLLFHRVDFFFLQVLGNLFVLPMGWLLWANFHPELEGQFERLLLFAPVPFLLFQLQYAQTLNWPMATVQNLSVVFFVLLCIHCFLRSAHRRYLYFGFAAFVLAVAASKNGLLAAVPALVILARARRWRVVVALLVVAMLAAYDYTHGGVSDVPPAPAAPHALALRGLPFAISFLGASFNRFGLAWGIVLCGAFLAMVLQARRRVNPFACYAGMFLLLTALAVSAYRTASGASRYKIYSDLLICLVYVMLAELVSRRTPRLRYSVAWVAICCSVAFSLKADCSGLDILTQRRAELDTQVAMWKETGHLVRPGQSITSTNTAQPYVELAPRAEAILREAARAGIYEMPSR